LTTRTYNDKFTNEKGRERMKIIEANIDYKLIGERIKEARRKAGLSQEKLAEMIDVTTVYVSKIERGGQINLKRLSQMSIALNVPIEKILNGTTMENENYLNKEFQELLDQCSKDKQRLIYNIAKIVSGIKFA
jgi:transcriptional regulator with XRE-family HTH domain